MPDGQVDPNKIMRLSPALAMEIGLNESIVLLQLQYLTEISTYEVDGGKWIRGSLPDLVKEHFPFLSVATLSRVISSLTKGGYLQVGNFNKFKYDRTQWLTLSLENCAKLNGFTIFQNEKSILQIDVMEDSKMKDASRQNERCIFQNETTIQEENYKGENYKGEIQRTEPPEGEERADAPPAAPAKVIPIGKAKTAKKSAEPDGRAEHPAIVAVRNLHPKSYFPPKEIWDLLIRLLGDEPDLVLLRECQEVWVSVGYKPNNYSWATDWYVSGIPERFKNRGSPTANGSLSAAGASTKAKMENIARELRAR